MIKVKKLKDVVGYQGFKRRALGPELNHIHERPLNLVEN